MIISPLARMPMKRSAKQGSAPLSLLRDPVHLFAFGFGAGMSPYAPGTFGTLVAVPIVLFVMQFGFAVHLAFAIAATGFGIYVCGESARRLGIHDHPGIVWDEITGFAVTMLAAPAESHGAAWWLCGGFVLFRLFDIWKPWPIREADHSLSGGLGIMLDDIIAGLFAGAILLGVRLVL
jgi:phosphatidylglycerophosphatase A